MPVEQERQIHVGSHWLLNCRPKGVARRRDSGFDGALGWPNDGRVAGRHRAGGGQRGWPAAQGTNMKIRKGRFSGTLGQEVYVNGKYGQVVRSRPRRPWRSTVGRLAVQYNMGLVVSA